MVKNLWLKAKPQKWIRILLDTCLKRIIDLKTDGTIIAVGKNYDGYCDVSELINSVEVSST